MKSALPVFVTDFGVVKVGPGFGRLLKQLEPALQKGTRTKERKSAAAKLQRLEIAVTVLAEVEWAGGRVLEQTP